MVKLKQTLFGSPHFWALVVGSVVLLAWLHLATPWICGFGDQLHIPDEVDIGTVHTLILLQSINSGIWTISWQIGILTRFLGPMVIYFVFVILVFAHYFLRPTERQGNPDKIA